MGVSSVFFCMAQAQAVVSKVELTTAKSIPPSPPQDVRVLHLRLSFVKVVTQNTKWSNSNALGLVACLSSRL